MPSAACRRILGPIALPLSLALALCGCSGGNGITVTSPEAGLRCVDDSPDCIGHRQAALKSLLDDPTRSWVKQRPDAAAHASGVRLFAYRTKKKELSCSELHAGRMEAESAPAALRTPGNGLSTSQISRSVILAGEIGRELGREFHRRCGKT